MKVQLINSYKKLSTVTENGLPVLDAQGNQVKRLKTMFRYGLVGATPTELELYKRFRSQDGVNYYREENGVALFHSNEFIGNSATLNHYVKEDGKIGFSVNTTEIDTMQAMAEKYPHMAVTLGNQIAALMLAGNTLKLDNISERELHEHDETLDLNG
jgi:hypothetical protein